MTSAPIFLRAHCRTPIVATTDAPYGLVMPHHARTLVNGVWQHGLRLVHCPDCGLFFGPLRTRLIKVLP